MSVGQLPGAFVPLSTAASTAAPMASTRRGRISPQTSKSESSITVLGMGVVTTSSSALMYLFSQVWSVVWETPVSVGLRKYAVGVPS